MLERGKEERNLDPFRYTERNRLCRDCLHYVRLRILHERVVSNKRKSTVTLGLWCYTCLNSIGRALLYINFLVTRVDCRTVGGLPLPAVETGRSGVFLWVDDFLVVY